MFSCKLCLTLCDPMDCRPPGSSVHGISQARILEWVTISFSQPKGVFPTQGSNLHLLHCRCFLYHWATSEAWSHGYRAVAKCYLCEVCFIFFIWPGKREPWNEEKACIISIFICKLRNGLILPDNPSGNNIKTFVWVILSIPLIRFHRHGDAVH